MSSPIAPCKGCSEREIGCHGSCEKYSEYRDVVNDIRKKQLEEQKYVNYTAVRKERLLLRCGLNARQL